MLTDIIAERKLKLSTGGNVFIFISKPRADGNEYRCDYQIIGIGAERVQYALGVDSIQALILALKLIGTELYISDEWNAGQLLWNSDEPDRDLGFPVSDVVADIPPSTPWR